MKLIHVLGLIVLASWVFPAGCSSTAGLYGESRASRESVRSESGSLRFPYDLSKTAREFSLTLTMESVTGSYDVAWKSR